MFLVRAIPISRGISKESLTYFSSTVLSPGHITTILLRNKEIPALIESVEAFKSEHKTDLKSMPFVVKKMGKHGSTEIFLPEFVKAVEKISLHHATSRGAVYQALTPQAILENAANVDSKLSVQKKEETDSKKTEHKKNHHILAFQADEETRIAHYKMIIREEFAKKQSVFILVPTAHEAETLKTILEKGIEQYTYALHGTLTKKNTLNHWQSIIEEKHPVLVIGTALFMSLPKLWSTMIIERESSRHYKMSTRPYLDMRTCAEYLAKEIDATCICSDLMLRVETLDRYDAGELQEVSELRWRSMTNAKEILIDLKNYNKDKKEFVLISDELKTLIEENKKLNRRLFLYVSRRGIASQIMCRDCGTTALCTRCSTPVVLHGSPKKENRYMLCHTCGERRPADVSCSVCGGWRLEAYGVGIENVVEQVKKIAPDSPVFRVDSDATPTAKKVLEAIDHFESNPGSILVGTEMALYYLNKDIEHVAIVSLDSQFSLPDFRIKEKIFHTILRLRSLASHVFLIQTRYAEMPLWQYAQKGNLMDFYKEEKNQRAKHSYPPACTLIKITFTGTPALVRAEMQKLKENFKDYTISIFPAFIETQKGKFVMHALIRLRNDEWWNQSLYEKLRALPPEYAVNVDPENVL
jgi:primosomal protein N' (replication factor Y)